MAALSSPFVKWVAPANFRRAAIVKNEKGQTFEAPERGNYPPAKWLSGQGWRHPAVPDTTSMKLAEAFGATSVPYFVFIEADGTVAFRMSGNIGPEQLSSAMKRLAGTSI